MEGKGKREEGRKTEMKKWREVPGAVADSGEGPGRPGPPLLTLDQTEARRAEKKFFETGRPPYRRVWMTPTPTPISEVWIRHWREREREGEKNGWKGRKKGRHEGRKKLRER